MRKLVLRIKKSDFIALSLQHGILLKGGKLPPGSIRVWGGIEYIKEASGKWKRKVQSKNGGKKAEHGNSPAVQYDGEYVLTREGNKDFGEISPEIARLIRRQSGKIRLRVGEQDVNSERGYGEKHIERHKRIKEIRQIGFRNARDFIEYIAKDFDAIYESSHGSLVLYKKGGSHTQIISRLEPSSEGDYWDVKTAYITRKDSKRNKKPLWERPKSGQTSE
jgi:hypothetical protein